MLYNAPLFWSRLAIEADRRDHTGAMNAVNQRGPTRSSRALAIVHIAIHDAYFWPYLKTGGTPPNPNYPLFYSYPFNTQYDANERAAVISGAAYAALTALYPAQRDLFRLGKDVFRPGMEASFDLGIQIGNEVIDNRRLDGSSAASGDVRPNGNRYDHREDPTNLGQGLLHPRWGEVRPFAVTSCPTLVDPPLPGSTDYLNDLREVFIKGSRTPPTRPTTGNFPDDRTADETVAAIYWGYDGAMNIGTPPRLYNQIVHTIICLRAEDSATRLAEAEVVRLLMFANIAMADAGIAAWFHKYRIQLWRPILGIREFDPSTGPMYQGQPANKTVDPLNQPFWTPLGAQRTNQTCPPESRPFTPNFPAYPSGHATFGAAVFEAVRLFLKVKPANADKIKFEFVSDEWNGMSIDSANGQRIRHVRKFDSLIDAMYENAVSRVHLGVHWRFDGLFGTKPSNILAPTKLYGGVPLGRSIAQDIWQHNINPSPTGTGCTLSSGPMVSLEHIMTS
jgi:hypothetical protein